MRLYYSLPLLSLLLLIGCSKSEQGTSIPEGHLELVWAVQPEGAEDKPVKEPWFADIDRARVLGDFVYVPDWMRNTIVVLDRSGAFVRTIGREGPGPGEFEGIAPSMLEVSNIGRIYGTIRPGSFNEYLSNGDYIKTTNHYGLFAGTSINPSWLLPIDENNYIYNCGLRARGFSPDELLQSPLLVRVTGNEWVPIATRWITEDEERIRSIVESKTSSAFIGAFTNGLACLGPNKDEVLFIKEGNPFEISRYKPNQDPIRFRYFGEPDLFGIQEFIVPPGNRAEYWPSYSFGRVGRDEPRPMFTWENCLKGLAVFGETLVVYVESPKDGTVRQSIYIVDLKNERLEMVIPCEFPLNGQVFLTGAFDDGTLIFSFFRPVPGIHAYKILESN